MHLCIIDLAECTGGTLRLAAMPPVAGELTAIGRIVLSAPEVEAGDVYWHFGTGAGDAQLAFFRGALGIVTAGRGVEPWPGRFCLQIDDAAQALARLCRRSLREIVAAEADAEVEIEELFLFEPSELKDLQLCAARLLCISPPTCGRSAKGIEPHRCRRAAA
jgi:hypothetical protein